MQGIHLLAEFHQCQGNQRLLDNAAALRELCVDLVRRSGLSLVGQHFHQFEPVGATGAIVLKESHLAIHTWPEHGYVSLDVFVCNLTTDNSSKARWLLDQLQQAFQPAEVETQQIKRGQPCAIPS